MNKVQGPLHNRTSSQVIAENLRIADSMLARAKGLLGEKSLPEGHTLWIKAGFAPCNSIHTWFMRFAIDAIFVDRKLVVKAVYQNLRPWRMTMPALGADSVFELPAGTLARHPVAIGDQLHVGD
jgi:uncharacterized membrane protein (UPF0127 family)